MALFICGNQTVEFDVEFDDTYACSYGVTSGEATRIMEFLRPKEIVYPHGEPVVVVDVECYGKIMKNTKAAALMLERQVCRFCNETGHSLKECMVRKNMQCRECGFLGHNHKKCNKIKKGPQGQIGCCTYKKCKGAAKWGHYIVTCPRRQEDFGDYVFPEDVDIKKALY